MNRWDWDIVLLIVNIVITFISGVGALNSIYHFRRNRNIANYAQANQALGEINKMLHRLPDVLMEINSVNTIKEIGKDLSDYLNAAMDAIPSDYSMAFRKLQKKNGFDLTHYINAMIEGRILIYINNRTTLDLHSFALCQERLREMQEFLKKKMAEEKDKLK